MAINYVCRYCHQKLGSIDNEVAEYRLGFHLLTPEERQDIIQRGENEVWVYVICESCQETLEHYPELALENVLLQ